RIRDFHVTGVQTCALPICNREQARVLCCFIAEPLSKYIRIFRCSLGSGNGIKLANRVIFDLIRFGRRKALALFSIDMNQTWACTLFQRFRSEEHTSELQSRENLVCRLLLEKKKRCI